MNSEDSKYVTTQSFFKKKIYRKDPAYQINKVFESLRSEWQSCDHSHYENLQKNSKLEVAKKYSECAVNLGSLAMIEWIAIELQKLKLAPVDTIEIKAIISTVFKIAAERFHYDILVWLVEHYPQEIKFLIAEEDKLFSYIDNIINKAMTPILFSEENLVTKDLRGLLLKLFKLRKEEITDVYYIDAILKKITHNHFSNTKYFPYDVLYPLWMSTDKVTFDCLLENYSINLLFQAIEQGDEDTLFWLYTQKEDPVEKIITQNREHFFQSFLSAVSYKHLNVLALLWNNNENLIKPLLEIEKNRENFADTFKKMVIRSYSKNDLALIELITTKTDVLSSKQFIDKNNSLLINLITKAVETKQLDILTWFLENTSLSLNKISADDLDFSDTLLQAVLHEDLELLEWFWENLQPIFFKAFPQVTNHRYEIPYCIYEWYWKKSKATECIAPLLQQAKFGQIIPTLNNLWDTCKNNVEQREILLNIISDKKYKKNLQLKEWITTNVPDFIEHNNNEKSNPNHAERYSSFNEDDDHSIFCFRKRNG